MRRTRVLVVGGGFGGVKAALDLGRHDSFHVILLSDRPTLHYHPALYHTATGGAKSISEIPLADMLADRKGEIIIDRAEKLDRAKRTITTASGKVVHFDVLIIALGSVTNYFGIQGLREYSYGIKTTEEAEELKAHLHQHMIDKNQPDLRYIIVGGGPTGIELAGALPVYIKKIMKQHGLRKRKVYVDLIEAAPRLLPRMPKKMSRTIKRRLRRLGVRVHLQTPVQAETASALLMHGRRFQSRTVIWTAGTTNNPFIRKNHFILAQNGRVQVDRLLQAWPGVYVIGDNADTPYSGMAQTALHDAAFVAKNLLRHVDGKRPFIYKPKRPVYVTPVGSGWAAVLWGKVQIYGRLGWLLRMVADFKGYGELENPLKATERMLEDSNEEDNCVMCAVKAPN